jgi:hypothetical protein
MCRTNRTRWEQLTPFAYGVAVIYVTKSWNTVRSPSVPASGCRARRGGTCRSRRGEGLPRYRNTGKVRPRRDRLAHPSACPCGPTTPANLKSEPHSADGQPRSSGASDLLPMPIRDSVTLDNCPSAVEPVSFEPLLDGHRQLAGCCQEGDARIRPVRFPQVPRLDADSIQLELPFATGFAHDEDITACRTRALASSYRCS